MLERKLALRGHREPAVALQNALSSQRGSGMFTKPLSVPSRRQETSR